jgi:DtxR family Mn-dependent transcriptional regulator
VEPGRAGGILANDGEEVRLALGEDGDESVVTFSVAETVTVTADPSPPPRKALPEQLVLGRERYGR